MWNRFWVFSLSPARLFLLFSFILRRRIYPQIVAFSLSISISLSLQAHFLTKISSRMFFNQSFTSHGIFSHMFAAFLFPLMLMATMDSLVSFPLSPFLDCWLPRLRRQLYLVLLTSPYIRGTTASSFPKQKDRGVIYCSALFPFTSLASHIATVVDLLGLLRR
jgi:hypothetical protein